ncbi:trypsin-like serine protease [Methyloglobulus sp.]|uniref:trypsin-like serine protease n=1 Tax=Methyloglobulus sp. TaxID=2518622 RepID=UPI0032B81AA5
MIKIPKRLSRFCGIVVLGVAAYQMPVAYAQNQAFTMLASDHSLDMDAMEYSKTYKVSFVEALRNLIIQLSSDDVVAHLQNKYKTRLAGMYAEHKPYYHLVVRLKGNARVLDTSFPIRNKTAVPFSEILDLPVEFQSGADYTLAELEKIRDAHLKEFAAIPGIQGTGIDERSGEVVLDIVEPKKTATANSSRFASPAPSFINLPIKINKLRSKLVNAAASVRASEIMSMRISPLLTSQLGGCTSGFNIKDKATGRLSYATTAAHCYDYNITLNDRKTVGDDKLGLIYVKEFHNASQDFQVMSVKPPLLQTILLPQFFAADNVAKPLTGRRTRASTVVGNTVCHYGKTTGYSCGTVKDKAYMPGLVGSILFKSCGPDGKTGKPAKPVVCSKTWVKVAGPKLDCFQGDSGGPVFIGNIAVGLLSKVSKNNSTWSSIIHKGKGWCGGNDGGTLPITGDDPGFLTYMSTDELYNAGYQLKY